jgi:hypothetical protein
MRRREREDPIMDTIPLPCVCIKFKVFPGKYRILLSSKNQIRRLEEYANSQGWHYEVMENKI